MKTKLYIITTVLLTLNLTSYCQYDKNFNVKEPNIYPGAEVASLGRYGQIPVGCFSGVPQISIPIYTLKTKDIEIPVTISYNASGIKVNDESTWVGLGWNLNVGGCVTRNIEDMPDKVYPREVYTTQHSAIDLVREIVFGEDGGRYRDTKPDVFSYNFLGYSGTFMLYENSNIIVNQENNGLTIEYVGDQTSQNYGFSFKLPNGVTFFFTETESAEYLTSIKAHSEEGKPISAAAYEAMIDRNPFPCKTFIVNWHLSSIETPSKDNIRFKYKESNDYSKTTYNMTQEYNSQPDYEGNLTTPKMIFDIMSFKTKISKRKVLYSVENYNEILYFNSISQDSQNNTAERKYSLKLNDITIKSKISDEIINKISFKYNYFHSTINSLGFYSNMKISKYDITTSNNINNSNYNPKDGMDRNRLKLESIIDGEKIHSFEYNSQELPPYNSFAIDWQGYYNGKDDNACLLPFIVASGYSFGFSNVSRACDSTKMQACILNKIHYPSKGYTIFEYENHKVGVNKTGVGGLRIKSIKNFNSNGSFISSQRYEYNNGTANGVINNGEQPVSRPKGYILTDANTNPDEGENNYDIYQLQKSNTIIDYDYLFFLSPSPLSVFYTDVKEMQVDSVGNICGYTRYEYDGAEDVCFHDSPPTYFLDMSKYRGNLLRKRVYDKNSTLIYECKMNYDWIEKKEKSILRFEFDLSLYPSPFNYFISGFESVWYDFIKSFYNIPLYPTWLRMTSKNETYYYSGNSIYTEENYEYDDRIVQPTVIKIKDSNGKVITTKFEYPFDYPEDPIFKEMMEKDLLPIVGKRELLGDKLVYHEFNKYKLFVDYYPYSTHIMNNGLNKYVENERINQYNWGRPVETVGKDGVITSYYYGGDIPYPLIVAKNLKYSDLDLFLGMNIPGDLDENGYYNMFGFIDENGMKKLTEILRKEFPKSMITCYAYRTPHMRLSAEYSTSGRIKYYEYDNENRLKYIKDKNGNIVQKIEYHYSNQ